MPSPRLLLAATPALAALTGLFGVFHLYVGAIALQQRAWFSATLYALLGVAGLALATGLWRVRQRVRGALDDRAADAATTPVAPTDDVPPAASDR